MSESSPVRCPHRVRARGAPSQGPADGISRAFTLPLPSADLPVPQVGTATAWLDDLHSDRVQAGTVGRFVFVPGSRPDEVDGPVLVEAAGPPGVLRTVCFARGETDEGLDVAEPVVVEGVLRGIRHPARGQFRAVIELQVREAQRVTFCQQAVVDDSSAISRVGWRS